MRWGRGEGPFLKPSKYRWKYDRMQFSKAASKLESKFMFIQDVGKVESQSWFKHREQREVY